MKLKYNTSVCRGRVRRGRRTQRGTSDVLTNVVITIAIRLRYDYDVSRAPASSSTQAKNEHVNFSS